MKKYLTDKERAELPKDINTLGEKIMSSNNSESKEFKDNVRRLLDLLNVTDELKRTEESKYISGIDPY